MTELRHEHLVVSNVHSHVAERYCTEPFVLEGTLPDISAFVGRIRATRDTLSVDCPVQSIEEFSQTLDAAEESED